MESAVDVEDQEVSNEVNETATYPSCVRCKDAITSGHAYELGDDRWHTHCFSCYRCEKPLSCDSDFLVLGTGTLICFDCSDSCKNCGKKIGDLAIILSSSNEAYCSDCFKCCKCGEQIKDLRYAKTKRGLFCIHCHEKLLAKRKHYEEKKRRLKKTLPDIPPTSDDSTKEFEIPTEAMAVPAKSSRRPLSPLRDHQRTESSQSSGRTHFRTNSESVISQYLDDDGSSDVLGETEASIGVGSNDGKENRPPTNAAKHERNVSIDDILNSTLENSDGVDSMNSLHLQEKKAENTRTLLNKTPLRNNHHKNNSFSKSPVGNRKGMILDNSNTEYNLYEFSNNKASSSSEDVERPFMTGINTPTAVNVVSPKIETENVFTNGSKQPLHNSSQSMDSSLHHGEMPINQDEQKIMNDIENRQDIIKDNERGLALSFSSDQERKTPNPKDEDTLTLGMDVQTLQSVTNMSGSIPEFVNASISQEDSGARGQTHQSSVTVSNHGKSSSDTNNGTCSQNGNGNVNRSIGRSLSMKSKNLVSNLRSRTSRNSAILDPKTVGASRIGTQTSPTATPPTSSSFASRKDSFDTHSGWGVASSAERDSHKRSPSFPIKRFTSRGRSDSTTHFEKRVIDPTSDVDIVDDHQRSHSNASVNSGIHVSMFRTPPLESTSAFSRNSLSESTSHLRNTSWQANIKKAEPLITPETNVEDENENFLKKDLVEAELQLRKLKLEIGDLESKRTHLKTEVDSLELSRDSLTQEISSLKDQKVNFTLSDSLEHNSNVPEGLEAQKMKESYSDNTSPSKQLNTASIARPATKPRFWKIFSGGKQQSNPPSQGQQQYYQQQYYHGQGTGYNPSNSYSSNSSSNNKIEISAPVLQNPNEFSDMKLFPISNKSLSSTSSQSSPLKQDGSVLYGSSLVARCSYEQSSIPKLILQCATHIESNEEFMRTEGIYRKSGSQLLIEQIEREFIACDSNGSSELENLMNEDVHAVASVLKRYLRKLPNPVFTFQIYEPLISIVRDNKLMTNLPLRNGGNQNLSSIIYKEAVESICKILGHLPSEHYEVLKFLTQHINRVNTYSESNLMNLYNLSLVFAPGLIRDYNGDKDIIDMKERNYIVGFIVGNYTDIF